MLHVIIVSRERPKTAVLTLRMDGYKLERWALELEARTAQLSTTVSSADQVLYGLNCQYN